MKIAPKTINLDINDRAVVKKALEAYKARAARLAVDCKSVRKYNEHMDDLCVIKDLLKNEFFSDLK